VGFPDQEHLSTATFVDSASVDTGVLAHTPTRYLFPCSLANMTDPGHLFTGARDVFLVVYAVLWGAAAPTFGRLRAFSFPGTFASTREARRFAWRRLAVGFALATAAPILLLATVWTLIPPTATAFWPMVGGALAGTSVAAFPRFVHGALASNQTHHWFYAEREWKQVIKDWDPLVDLSEPEPTNNWLGFLVWGLVQLLVPVFIGVSLATAGAYPSRMSNQTSSILEPLVGVFPQTAVAVAVWLSGLTLLAVLYDIIWIRRPRLRMRIRKWHGSTDLDLLFINRGGAAYTVIQVRLEISLPDGKHLKTDWDTEPIEVPAYGARHARLQPPADATGYIWIEAVPMGDRFVSLPEPGWQGHSLGPLRRLIRRLTGWGDIPKGVSRELRGYRTPPDPDANGARPLR